MGSQQSVHSDPAYRLDEWYETEKDRMYNEYNRRVRNAEMQLADKGIVTAQDVEALESYKRNLTDQLDEALDTLERRYYGYRERL